MMESVRRFCSPIAAGSIDRCMCVKVHTASIRSDLLFFGSEMNSGEQRLCGFDCLSLSFFYFCYVRFSEKKFACSLFEPAW